MAVFLARILCTAAVVFGFALGTTLAAAADALPSWNDGKSKQSVVEFVKRVTAKGGKAFIPPAERIAVFDNDGTLWAARAREWAYDRKSHIGRLDKALDEAGTKGWTVVDMKADWTRVFSFEKQ